MTVRLHYADTVAVLTLDRPAALNALNAEMLAKLSDLLDEIAQGDARSVVIMGGGDRAFCAGADIVELRTRSAEQHLEAATYGQEVFSKLASLLIPTIAVIRGAALGGGLELALACTYRIALSNAKFGLPEIKLGLIPGYGGTQRLPKLIGASQAMELVLSGRIIDAQNALALGLVDKVTDDPLADPLRIARDYLNDQYKGHPAALHLAREAVRASTTLPLEAGLNMEARLFVLATQSADAVEGIDAFLTKRPAVFSGR
ncbi:enoyl-CoA hydratase/isomerase family protein [Pseudomonas synxantha]|uniref:Enoyl-CoA hydratase/isomerase family protein n=1 Tax=Pseudomonas synxantha TaxID=47883 RepID=A0ABS0UM07_9PSED|nr:enoyl-CoA hydratase-related protein [Pseudomonas synxantha]MBI6566216.1 enoyl-CoA hydratase/isomerase family protein [Pseudomonas synxantha]MBI6584604.1 enoyl-CoA hydratase/isomerase family protein [Pseudomonas synxantha]MBI6646755.1 enoyl-CoA hydratase/isomerase family protein [Pseudomonas synxantha]